MNRPFKFAILAIILVMPIYSAKASEVRAFHNINQLPFKQIFGLPSLDNSPVLDKVHHDKKSDTISTSVKTVENEEDSDDIEFYL